MDLESWKSRVAMAADTFQQLQSLDKMAEEDEYIKSPHLNVSRRNSGNSARRPPEEDLEKGPIVDEEKDRSPPAALSLVEIPSFSEESISTSREWSLLDIPVDVWHKGHGKRNEEQKQKRGEEEDSTSVNKTGRHAMPMLSAVKALMEETGDEDDDVDNDDDDKPKENPAQITKKKSFDDGYDSFMGDSSDEENPPQKHHDTSSIATDSLGEDENHEFIKLLKEKKDKVNQQTQDEERHPIPSPSSAPHTDTHISNDNNAISPLQNGDETTDDRKPIWFDVFDENAVPLPTQERDPLPLQHFEQQQQHHEPSLQQDSFLQLPTNTPKWLRTLTTNPKIHSLYQHLQPKRPPHPPSQPTQSSAAPPKPKPIFQEEEYQTIFLSSSFHDDELAEWERIQQMQNHTWKQRVLNILERNERFIFIGVTMIVASCVYFYSRKRALS